MRKSQGTRYLPSCVACVRDDKFLAHKKPNDDRRKEKCEERGDRLQITSYKVEEDYRKGRRHELREHLSLRVYVRYISNMPYRRWRSMMRIPTERNGNRIYI